MRVLFLFSMVLAISFLTACETGVYSERTIKYPYHASPEKEKNIIENAKKILNGMSSENVKKILGEPDEINQTYSTPEEMRSKSPSGFSYIYLIQRMKELGTISQRNERLLRVYFDKDGRVSRTERIGFK
ncbi:MAG: hypothetical protein A2017_12305 [Lentisphaerae bacterium GWF2_44_16]|nr:MAG: hypothetical protein A2017_12305 [Lentisphaerae bacterium GWF2_44_16]